MKSHVAGLARAIVRESAPLMALSYKARGIRGLDSLGELDAFLADCMQGSEEVTPAALERMSKAYLRVPKGVTVPKDPFSRSF